MPRSENQKSKILYLMRMLWERTDSSHIITMQEILAELGKHEIRAERKSIYSDIDTLRRFGMDIEVRKGPPAGYCLVSRELELPELKLLADAIETSSFVPEEKGGELIRKLQRLTSYQEAEQLQRKVHVGGRAEVMEQSVWQSVDKIQEAIHANSGILFQYFTWNVDKTRKMKRNGGQYRVSPWRLAWSEGRYYLFAYDAEGKKIKIYQVDKMMNISLTKEPRQGKEAFESFGMADYIKKSFAMQDGEEKSLTLRADYQLAGAIMERFGMETPLRQIDKDTFQVKVRVRISNQFYGWLAGFGKGIRIASPQEEAENYRKYLKRILKEYK